MVRDCVRVSIVNTPLLSNIFNVMDDYGSGGYEKFRSMRERYVKRTRSLRDNMHAYRQGLRRETWEEAGREGCGEKAEKIRGNMG